MNTGIIIGMVTSIVAIFLNYLNLFGFKDFSTGTKEGVKIKHWLITYYASWIIAVMPFIGLFFNWAWLIKMAFTPGYKCTNHLFKEV